MDKDLQIILNQILQLTADIETVNAELKRVTAERDKAIIERSN